MEYAKKILEKFDLILLSENMTSTAHTVALKTLFQIPIQAANSHKLKGDAQVRLRLSSQLAADEVNMF